MIVTNIYHIQVTTHSHLLSHDELACVSNALFLDKSHIHAFSLQEFDTELDFSNRVRYVQLVHPHTTKSTMTIIVLLL